MNDQQFTPDGLQHELDARIQAAHGNIAAVRQELEKQLKNLGAQQDTQVVESAEARETNGEIAMLRGELLYLDSLAKQQKSQARPGQQRHSGSAQQAPAGIMDKWRNAQFTKTHLLLSALAGVALTLLIGFMWAGWMTTSGGQELAETTANAAVVERLAPICVAQFNLDPAKDVKLQEMTAIDSYKRAEYVRNQGWATMPGEVQPDRKVADACVKLLMQSGQ